VTSAWKQPTQRGPLSRALLAGAVLCIPVAASGADYGADVALASIYTDNLTLAPDDLARSQWVNSIVPHVYYNNDAARWSAEFDYQLQALFYAGESELNEAFSQLWATGALNVIGDELLLRGFARALQVNLDPEGRLPDNNINITGNRTDVVAGEIGPQWQQLVFGASSFVDAYYYVGRINYSEDGVQGADTQDAQFSLSSNLDSPRSLTYEIFYRYRNFDYDDTGPAKFQQAFLELGFFVTPLFQLVGVVGLESDLVANTGRLDEPYWEAGIRSWFGANRVEAFYGRRFFGPTYRLTWQRNMQVSTLRMTYVETQQTDETRAIDDLAFDVEEGLDPAQGETLAPDTTIDQPGSGARSLNKRFIADYRTSLYRTEIDVFSFWRRRKEITPITDPMLGAPDFLRVDESYGLGFKVSWAAGTKTTASVFANWTRREFDVRDVTGADANDLYQGNIRLDYNLGLFTEIRALVGYQKQSGGDTQYDELHAALRLKRYFGTRR